MSRWNIDDCITFEVLEEDLPEVLKGKGITEVCIHFNSQGYYSPAVITGDPYDSSPEEGDDERNFLSAEAYATNDDVILTEKEQKMLFDRFEDKVNEADLNWEEPEPDYDDRDD